MRKYILALCVAFLMTFSAGAWAATPDATVFSGEQELAVKWTEAMLNKQQPAEALKIMSREAQQNIQAEEMNKISAEITKNLGTLKTSQFVSWNRLPQVDQVIYLMSFEKEKIVRCVFLYDKKGQLNNFALTPMKEEKQDKKDK